MSTPEESAAHDFQGPDIGRFFDSLDYYIDERLSSALCAVELHRPRHDPAEGIAYHREMMRLNLSALLTGVEEEKGL